MICHSIIFVPPKIVGFLTESSVVQPTLMAFITASLWLHTDRSIYMVEAKMVEIENRGKKRREKERRKRHTNDAINIVME